MNHYCRLVILSMSFLLLGTGSSYGQDAESKKVHASIKKMLNFALRQKPDEAMKQVGVEQMSKFLLGNKADKATPEQRQKFKELVRKNIELRAFPVVEEHFKSVDIPLEKAVFKGSEARVKSSLLWGGSEQVSFTWILSKDGDKYVITDFINSKGQSSMEQNQKNVQKVIETEGMDKLLANFEEQLSKIKK